MKLLYIVDIKIPTPKAHGIHVAKMCEAFGKQGVETVLVVPKITSSLTEDPFHFYSLKPTFTIRRVPCINIERYTSSLGYWLRSLSFPFVALALFLFTPRADVQVHTRDSTVALLFRLFGFRVSYEAHRIPKQKRFFFSKVKMISRIVANSEGVAREFRERGFSQVLVARHGVDAEPFLAPFNEDAFKRTHGIPTDACVVMYTGSLYGWKGIRTLMDATKILKDNTQVIFVLLGGTDGDVLRTKELLREEGIENVILLGHRPVREVPFFVRSADVLLLPNDRSTAESVHYTSPTKLPEYMASGVPIVASDLPSLRALLRDDTALFFEPENAVSLAEAISRVINDPDTYAPFGVRAKEEALSYTWDTRAEALLSFIGR